MLNTTSLAQFTGTQSYTRVNPFPRVLMTEGALYVDQNGGEGQGGTAGWLMTEIACAQLSPAIRAQPFQVFKLKKNKTGSGAKLIIEDGNNNVIGRKAIPYTDFDFANGGNEFTLWATEGALSPDGPLQRIIMLPSEY